MKSSLTFVSALALTAASSGVAWAQCEIDRPQVTNSVGSIGELRDGRITLVDGFYTIRTYEPGPQRWMEVASQPPPGFSLAQAPNVTHRGGLTAIGLREDGTSIEGRVHLFDSTGHSTVLAASDRFGFDAFGSAVALHDGLVVVGASMVNHHTGGAYGPGKGYVFENVAGVWTETVILHPHDFSYSYTDFGFEIDTDGATIVFGSAGDDSLAFGAGAAYVYERVGGVWTEVAKLTASDGGENHRFGTAVAVLGDQLLVGAPGTDALYVFQRQAAGWVEIQKLDPVGGAAGDAFGTDIDIDGDRAVVGAPDADSLEMDTGAFYVIERGASSWAQVHRVDADDASVGAGFGHQARLDGNQVLWAGDQYASEVRVTSLGIDHAVSYCVTSPNSTGAAATISARGCDSRIAGQLTLAAADVPPGRFGLFFYGTESAQLPLANGTLCIRAPQSRLVPTQSDSAGVMTTTLGFTAPQASSIAPGTWRFQAYFRDPAFGAGAGLTDALEIQIHP